MTSPPSPPVQRRVEALLTEPPEHASVTVDLSRFPVPEIPYLTIVKWALSTPQSWPLLAEKRPSDAEDARSATFDLTHDELRRVVYDDLKRSLWRPTPDGLTLDWDASGRVRAVTRRSTSSDQSSSLLATLLDGEVEDVRSRNRVRPCAGWSDGERRGGGSTYPDGAMPQYRLGASPLVLADLMKVLCKPVAPVP